MLGITVVAVVGSYFFVGKDFALIILPIGIILSVANLKFLNKTPAFLKVIITIALLSLWALWAAFIATGGAAALVGQ